MSPAKTCTKFVSTKLDCFVAILYCLVVFIHSAISIGSIQINCLKALCLRICRHNGTMKRPSLPVLLLPITAAAAWTLAGCVSDAGTAGEASNAPAVVATAAGEEGAAGSSAPNSGVYPVSVRIVRRPDVS